VHDGAADREWMVVDGDGRFVSQRDLPALALVAPSVHAGGLRLDAPGRAPLVIDAARVAGDARDVQVWRSHVRGHDAGDDAARWLSAHLGRDVRLVRFDRSKPRRCNPDFVGRSGAHTLFADGYPVLVIGSASLADLNARLAARGHAALPMDRFRPNVVVDGLAPYDEDHVDTLTAGDVVLRMVKGCTRCQVTTIDQASATPGIEPLPTLATYRHDARLAGVTFGMNAIVERGGALVAGQRADVSMRF
jgi:uncharacterized protein YcbX